MKHIVQLYLAQLLLVIPMTLMPKWIIAQAQQDLPSLRELKKLSIEELMNLEVISVSKRAEKLTEVASAIQVITHDDIMRSGATNLLEALRLATNLQVAQLNSYAWIVSARGFNAVFSNKLLVMIDGRTVYSPLFAGVFWDAQNVLLEDIDRIEVVSGPGGTLWGANAVNGVINIITKSPEKTQGIYASAALGSFLQRSGEIRYGGTIGPKFSYRVYGQHRTINNTYQENGRDTTDNWNITQAGFKTDWNLTESDNLTFQSNFYSGTEFTSPAKSTFDGQNVLGRWTHTISDKSDLIVQAYIDRTWRRDIPSTISDELETYDIDFQHNFFIGTRHRILWGAGARLMQDQTQHSTPFIGILPLRRDMHMLSGFVQDEIALIPDAVKLTIGTKLQHNNFSGFEVQPSTRLAWTLKNQTFWAAVSRAIRAPSRIDVDYFIPTYPVPAETPHVAGGPDFVSEKVIAYEFGYHMQPTNKLSLSLATFYNQYDDIYSVEALPGTQIYQIQNGVKGDSKGIEISGTYQLGGQWRLRGGYTYFEKNLRNKPGHISDPSALGNDPQNQLLLQSIINLPLNFQLDFTARYADKRLKPYIADYFTIDPRLAWAPKHWELSLTGQNIWEKRHKEYSYEIPRSIYFKVSWWF